MPHIAGRWKSWCIITAENIVNAPRPITTLPPFLMLTFGSAAGSKCGLPAGTTRTSKNAVTSQPMIEAGKSAKKSIKGALPAAHAISVVMSPNGLHAPPAFAATTMFIAPATIKFALFLSIVKSTVERMSAVVRLSATGLIKNAKTPVSQKSLLYV